MTESSMENSHLASMTPSRRMLQKTVSPTEDVRSGKEGHCLGATNTMLNSLQIHNFFEPVRELKSQDNHLNEKKDRCIQKDPGQEHLLT